MENEKMPADWAIAKAADGTVWRIEEVKTAPHPVCAWILKLARYIEAHEEPPVDRKLLCAREAVAHMLELEGSSALAAEVRGGGEYDEKPGVLCCLKFHELWDQGFGK